MPCSWSQPAAAACAGAGRRPPPRRSGPRRLVKISRLVNWGSRRVQTTVCGGTVRMCRVRCHTVLAGPVPRISTEAHEHLRFAGGSRARRCRRGLGGVSNGNTPCARRQVFHEHAAEGAMAAPERASPGRNARVEEAARWPRKRGYTTKRGASAQSKPPVAGGGKTLRPSSQAGRDQAGGSRRYWRRESRASTAWPSKRAWPGRPSMLACRHRRRLPLAACAAAAAITGCAHLLLLGAPSRR